MTSLLGIWMLATVGFGWFWHGAPDPDRCRICGADTSAVSALMSRVEQAPCGRDRVRAARQLRYYDWRCHPAAAISLVTAMLLDEDDDVREAAARSLARMKPCLPEVHMALMKVAQTDPDAGARRWAIRGLKAIGRRCQGACSACEAVVMQMQPAPTVPVIPGPPASPMPEPTPPPPAEELPPPGEPGHSPFKTPTAHGAAPTLGPGRLADNRLDPELRTARGRFVGRSLRAGMAR